MVMTDVDLRSAADILDEVPPLPDTLGELLEVALKEARAVEQSEKYVLDMGSWHGQAIDDDAGRCHVCLAGSVIRNHVPIDMAIYEDHMPADLRKRMLALDFLQMGNLSEAWYALGGDPGHTPEFDDLIEDAEERFDALARHRRTAGLTPALMPQWWTAMSWLKSALLKGGW
jgi:hypothetical protein